MTVNDSQYSVDVCPKCLQPSEYDPNPYYIYKCKICGFEGTEKDVLNVVDDKAVKKDIAHLERLLKENKRLSYCQRKAKSRLTEVASGLYATQTRGKDSKYSDIKVVSKPLHIQKKKKR
jgi:hypothetical protein